MKQQTRKLNMFHIPDSILKLLKNVETTRFHLNCTYTKGDIRVGTRVTITNSFIYQENYYNNV